MNTKHLSVPAFATVSLIALAATGAAAQTSDPGSDAKYDEVIVTGSRIARRDYEASSPIMTTPQDAIEATGQPNIENVLNQLPQFQPALGDAQQNLGGGGISTLNLRGLGAQRNLVLLDGRRLPLSSALGYVDVNNIPSSILDGVEVITGGASAVYGSDAVSGVVNFKTPEHFSGLQIDSQYGNSTHFGAADSNASIAGGGQFANEKGYAFFTLGFTNREAVNGNHIPFYSQGVLSSYLGTGTYTPSATNLPTQAAVNSVFSQYGVASGTVSRTGNLGFNNNGTLFSQNLPVANYQGTLAPYFSLTNNTLRQPVSVEDSIISQENRYNFFTKLSYELPADIKAYARVLYVDNDVWSDGGATPTAITPATGLSVPVTNPFIPADLATILASRSNPTAAFSMADRFMELPNRTFDEHYRTEQIMVGLKGTLPIRDWKWDVYASHDSSDITENQQNAVILSHVENLLNAPDGGKSICAGGFNIFGLGQAASLSQACKNYMTADLQNITELTQNIVDASLTGSLFSLPADDLGYSIEFDHRENGYSYRPSTSLQSGDVIGAAVNTPTTGNTAVNEISAEFLVPILANLPLVKSLNLDTGYRFSSYDLVGNTSTEKAELDWHPIKEVMFRAGVEKAIRAPNIGELFTSPTSSQVQIGNPPAGGDPCDIRSAARTGPNAANVANLCLAQGVPSQIINNYIYSTTAVISQLSGSTQLKPETGKTYTLGAVWKPEYEEPLLHNFSASVDYYNIGITRVIAPISGTTAINKCFNLDGSNPSYSVNNVYCQLITRNSTGGINSILTPYQNLGGLKTGGVDVQLDWNTELENFGAPGGYGTVAINSNLSFTQDYKVQLLPNTPYQDYGGTIDPSTTSSTGILPSMRAVTTFTYKLGPASVDFRWQYTSAMNDVSTVTSPKSHAPGVDAYSLFSLFTRWRMNEQIELRGGINNLFDKQPPVVSGLASQTVPSYYDVIGRAFFVGCRANF